MYKTQMEAARAGILTAQMKTVLEKECIREEELLERVSSGTIAIPANINHKSLSAEGVGSGLKTEINVNLGVSKDDYRYEEEWKKVELAENLGAHAIMDLSNYGKTANFRRELIEKTPLMIGTVPMYDAIGYLEKKLQDITVDDFFKVIEHQAKEGVDFMTIHAGINCRTLSNFKETNRITNIVSRGGSLIYAWMEMTGNENPFYEHYDRLMELLREYDVTISIGDSLRPGCLHDSSDASQISELIELGILTKRAWEHGVQVMIEGPGHMAINEIAANMEIEKKLCHGAPFYVLGPIVTDIAPGYDHITAAIGGAIAATYGADFLCYVTPAEHLGLPTIDDVKEGVIASRIAGHAADIVKGVNGAKQWDLEMSKARKALDWEKQIELAIDPEKAKKYRKARNADNTEACSMCGDYCAMKIVGEYLEK